MKIFIVGGTGHIGKQLVPMLLGDGHDVTVISSGRTAVPQDDVWRKANVVVEKYGGERWIEFIGQQNCEVFIDILGGKALATYDTVRSSCKHFVACGSQWMFGPSQVVPVPERTHAPCLFDSYAQRYADLLQMQEQAARDGIAFTAIMPPNICGPGKIPLDGHGGRGIEVHKSHQRGEPVFLPELGNTLIGPCDAYDVAQGFYLAVSQRDAADGHLFNVGAEYALTSTQFIQTYAAIYGCSIPIELCTWQDYSENKFPEVGAHYHFQAHMCPDLTKIKTQLSYQPRYTPEETMQRAVDWMKQQSLL